MKNRSLTGRTYLYYVADMLLCVLFLLMMSEWLWLQIILAIGLLAGFCLLCYNEGGAAGERACSIERMTEKREAAGKSIDASTKAEFFDKKKAVKCFIAASLPLAILATVNLAISPNYPVVTYESVESSEEEEDPFAMAEADPENEEQAIDEPAGQLIIRVITRIAFSPLLPLYTLLETNTGLLYALFIPFSFVMPACTAIGYLNGPKIREKKLMDIARGKVRKKRGLLVGGRNNGPRQSKPLV